jgi:hypothetical protein
MKNQLCYSSGGSQMAKLERIPWRLEVLVIDGAHKVVELRDHGPLLKKIDDILTSRHKGGM